MKMITSFNPSLSASGAFKHQIANPCGGVYLFNESNQWLQLTLPDGGNVGLPAWWARFYKLETVQGDVQWQVLDTIATVATPLSKVYGESYERNEIVGRNFYDGPIPRNPYIANNVSSSVSTNQVVNDGNLLMPVVEATLQGNTGGSNAVINNDGSFIYAQWVSSVFTQLLALTPGASPVLKMGKGLVLQAVDNSGLNLSNILGIDSSGNTFIQNHATNDNTNIYDKNGNVIATFGGANQTLNIAGTTQTKNGDTSGTSDTIEGFIGPWKMMMYRQNNYRQAGTAQVTTLNTPFTFGAVILNMGAGGIQLKQAGAAQTLQIVTALASGGGTSTGASSINTASHGWLVTNFNQIADSGAMGSARSGLFFAIGL